MHTVLNGAQNVFKDNLFKKSYLRFWVLKLHFTTWGFKAFDQNKMFLVIRPDNSSKMIFFK